MIEKLRSQLLSEYLEVIKDIRNKNISVCEEDFKYICAVYRLYEMQFDDLKALQEKILELLKKHKEKIVKSAGMISAYIGIRSFTRGYIEGRYDDGGNIYGKGTLEMETLANVNEIQKILEDSHPEDAKIFKEYSDVLCSIEEAFNDVTSILRVIGNKYLRILYANTLQIEPVFKSLVLKALDVFVNDEGVIKFYNDYINFFSDIKKRVDSDEARHECDALILEAEGCLKNVDLK